MLQNSDNTQKQSVDSNAYKWAVKVPKTFLFNHLLQSVLEFRIEGSFIQNSYDIHNKLAESAT